MFRRSKTRRKKNAPKGRLRRFLKTVALSATFSFVATSWALHPQLFTDPGQYLDEISLPKVSFEGFHPEQLGQPIKALLAQIGVGSDAPSTPSKAEANGGYIQTQFAQCPHFFPDQQRPIVPSQAGLRELCFTPFAILHSGEKKTPVFVAQRLNRQMLQAAEKIKRNDRFYEEARLPQAERASLGDYRGSGFDRGHMAPAGDMHNEESMAQSFSLANIVPQNAQHNRGAWSKIEQDTRKYIKRAQGDVYLFTGPVYSPSPDTIGDRQVAVPTYLYKVVYDASTGKAWVHWHENSPEARAGAPISYAEFVRRTGLHFLTAEQLQP